MKKLLVMVIAMLLVLPLVANAANCDPTKDPCVVIADETDDNAREDTNDVSGEYTKWLPVYIEQPTEKDVKKVEITITSKSNDINEVVFEAIENSPTYSVSADGTDKFIYSLVDGKTAQSETKFLIGYAKFTFKGEGRDCSLGIKQRITNGVETGAFVSYIALAAGVVLIGAIYSATRNKKKLYNI